MTKIQGVKNGTQLLKHKGAILSILQIITITIVITIVIIVIPITIFLLHKVCSSLSRPFTNPFPGAAPTNGYEEQH